MKLNQRLSVYMGAVACDSSCSDRTILAVLGWPLSTLKDGVSSCTRRVSDALHGEVA